MHHLNIKSHSMSLLPMKAIFEMGSEAIEVICRMAIVIGDGDRSLHESMSDVDELSLSQDLCKFG